MFFSLLRTGHPAHQEQHTPKIYFKDLDVFIYVMNDIINNISGYLLTKARDPAGSRRVCTDTEETFTKKKVLSIIFTRSN